MAIIESLRKLVDPVNARAVEQERRAARQQPIRETAASPPRFRCRICGLEDEGGNYCPACLADTMKTAAARRQGVGDCTSCEG